jgi:hypothetical protein
VIYTAIVGTSKQVQLIEPEFDDAPMTTADSIVCRLIGSDGQPISTDNMTYTANLPWSDTWGWYVNVNLPSQAQNVEVQIEVSKSGATARFDDRIKVRNFI